MRDSLTTQELARLSAQELLELKLNADERARLQEINKLREQERLASVARVREEETPLVKELQAAGLTVQSVGDLVGTSEDYGRAVPILLKHLRVPYSDVVRSSIARALAISTPEVRRAWPVLVEEFRMAPTGVGIIAPGDTKERPLGAKAGLACALSAAVTDDTLEELIELAKEPKHGESRVLLLSALRVSRNPIAAQALRELANDPDLQREIRSWQRT